MRNFPDSALWGLVVAATLLVGGAIAARLELPERLAATVSAFGGGTLTAAVALELVPEADELAGAVTTSIALMAGAVIYVAADAALTRQQHAREMRRAGHAAAAGREMQMSPSTEGRGESIAVGIFIDGVPESLALGLSIAAGEVGVALLAGIIIGNVIEAYGAAQPIIASGRSRGFALRLLGLLGVSLAVATILGGTVLADASGGLVGGAQAIAAGAVLAVISLAVIPYAFEEVQWVVAIALVLGFVCGYALS